MPPNKIKKDISSAAERAALKASAINIPLTLICSGTLSSWIQALAQAQGVPSDYILTNLIPMVNVLVGSTTKIEIKKDWFISPGVYCVTVGPSGTAKSEAYKYCVTDPIRMVQFNSGDCETAGGNQKHMLIVDQFLKLFTRLIMTNGKSIMYHHCRGDNVLKVN